MIDEYIDKVYLKILSIVKNMKPEDILYGQYYSEDPIYEPSEHIYAGNAGLLFALTNLAKFDKNIDSKILENLANYLYEIVLSEEFKQQDLSFLHGSMGILYCLMLHYDEFAPKLNKRIINILINNSDGIKNYTKNNDLFYGNAGIIITLYHSLKYNYKKEIIVNIIKHLVKKIISELRVSKSGIYWPNYKSLHGLCGMGHGSAGIYYIFGVLKNLKYFNHLDEFIVPAILHENSYYLPKRNNWIDLRDQMTIGDNYLDYEKDEVIDYYKNFDDKERHLSAWCHGNLGINLARYLTADKYCTKFKTKKSTKQWISLCHGFSGYLDILITTNEFNKVDNKIIMTEYFQLIDKKLNENNEISLMLGWSGVLNTLLRVKDKTIPTILCPCI